jgi:hypothetical protein
MLHDFSRDVMVIDGVEHPLKPYRKWLLVNHESLVTGHFIKSLRVGEIVKFYYDWQTIYFLASEYGFLNNYLANEGIIK